MQFTKLRLSGFKSFVEPIELMIEGGLTGIVGPNGCGKSNLLEAVRWVMGETAAKKLRGSEMDDVIFSGTASRPPRNIAEVSIHLDNGRRDAPAAFNDHDEIEIVRRIERGQGSTYRVNGKEVRARDVQLIFADSATGARSTALVSQGRLGGIINAKPTDRRGLLEEAAGITGLHSRRHEAELRLRAAETNLERLDDVLQALSTQLQGLKRQSRQASRYRNISDHIRKAKAVLYHLRWTEAQDALAAARHRLDEVAGQLAEQAKLVSAKTSEQGSAAGAVPPLRQAEAESADELHRLSVAREQLESEEARIADARRAVETRLEQIAADTSREEQLVADAEAAMTGLETERAELAAARDEETERREQAGARVEHAAADVARAEAAFTRQAETVAAADAHRAEIARQLRDNAERIERIRQRLADIADEREGLEQESHEAAGRAEAEAQVSEAEARLESTRLESEQAEAVRAAAGDAEGDARNALHQVEARLSKLRAEEQALAELVEAGEVEHGTPLLDSVAVSPGYEAALGAALGDDLSAPANRTAPVRWHDLPPLTAAGLPAGVEPLDRFVEAPHVLARRLSQVGVVADDATGIRLQESLAAGQRLVSRDGALWRWDGYTVAAGAHTAAATRLAQRNRLVALRDEIGGAEAETEAARARFEAARRAAAEAAATEKTTRETANRAFRQLSEARHRLSEITERTSAVNSRLSALAETADTLKADLEQAETALEAARAAEADLASPEADRAEYERLREILAEKRRVLAALQHESEQMLREAEARERRLAAIAEETENWGRRVAGSRAQLSQLEARRSATEADLRSLAARPDEIAAQRHRLMDSIEAAEARRREAADRLAEAEAHLSRIDGELKEAEGRLADLREERGLADGAARQAEQACDVIAERIAERLKCGPEDALAAGGVKEGETLPTMEAIDARLQRLIKERDNMGPVNLRAEEESRELEEQITSLQNEREDLVAAINKFRQGIGELNREGRERLLASFEEVDKHFQELFVRLFGGGRAHLKLTESDDPLEAGLEIMASPPGKRLQVLSLLSGGEQALTALALLFAVFLTNPAPICVLDEVDAPLDDANVDRFCSALEDIAHSLETRFVVITHHRMSMARMDRLFGVTMPEQGVSQMVSVDLQKAERLRETA